MPFISRWIRRSNLFVQFVSMGLHTTRVSQLRMRQSVASSHAAKVWHQATLQQILSKIVSRDTFAIIWQMRHFDTSHVPLKPRFNTSWSVSLPLNRYADTVEKRQLEIRVNVRWKMTNECRNELLAGAMRFALDGQVVLDGCGSFHVVRRTRF